MDQPASSQALWSIYDATGIRPEWLLPVLASESGLNPAIQNTAGFPYYGLNQLSGTWIQNSLGVSPQIYLTWPASQQLLRGVLPYLKNQVSAFGPLQSGIRVYQANFYPASLTYARGLDDTIVASPSAAYNANVGLDPNRDGRITPRDLGAAVGRQAAKAYVRSAIDSAYAVRPGEVETDPVYGLDFSRSPSASVVKTLVQVALIGVVTGAVANLVDPSVLPRWARI